MSFRVFALIVGIDRYKSGHIWNLMSCIDDAQNMKHWFTHHLGVPQDHICLLVNDSATKQGIEDSFMSHLVNNPEIEVGDAIIIYFAGHGTSVPAPVDWPVSNSGNINILCTYDQDCRKQGQRVAGILDRSLHAMIDELAEVKGRNITVIVDGCFTPRSDLQSRNSARWTPCKLSPEDLYAGLWRSAIAKTGDYTGGGFFDTQYNSHVLLLACTPGGKAEEGKDGGRFTIAFLQATKVLPLHETTYRQLTQHLADQMSGQLPKCVGHRKDSLVFNQVPFVPHASFISLSKDEQKKFVRIEAGRMHGVAEGTEFSIHRHNFHASHNPSLSTFHATEVHHTWCTAKPANSMDWSLDDGKWAKVKKWNNVTPFRVHLRRSYTSIVTGIVQGRLPWGSRGLFNRDRVSFIRVKNAEEADVMLRVRSKEIVVKNCSKSYPFKIRLPSSEDDDDDSVVEKVVQFHDQLSRANPTQPLRNHIRMKLYSLDPESWNPTGRNIFNQGQAKLPGNEDSVYTVHIHNDSHTDLWAYLVYMDTRDCTVKILYRPDSSTPPLKRHSRVIVGSGTPESEAIKFPKEVSSVGYLKLFVSSHPTCLDMIEQPVSQRSETSVSLQQSGCSNEIWDTVIGSVLIL